MTTFEDLPVADDLTPRKLTHGRQLYRAVSIDLYSQPEKGLGELIKNAACACQLDDHSWDPSRVRIDIDLLDKHLWCPWGKMLFVGDIGHGFRKEDWDRFYQIAQDGDRPVGRNHALGQKNMGRYGAWALNAQLLLDQSDARTGFFVLTRAEKSGRVIVAEMTPESFCEGRLLQRRWIAPDSEVLGPYAGRSGTFTVILVPHCVFSSVEKVRKAASFYLPRKPSKQFLIFVGDQRLEVPALSSKATHYQSTDRNLVIEAYLDRIDDQDPNACLEGGIWLADGYTGWRCAHAPTISRHLGDPLGRPDLVGEIYVDVQDEGKALLANQSTDRSTLHQAYLSSKFWRNHIQPALNLHIAPFAKDVLGDRYGLSLDRGGPLQQSIKGIIDLFHSRFGRPSGVNGPLEMGNLGLKSPLGKKGRREKAELPEPRKSPPEGGSHSPRPNLPCIRTGKNEYYLSVFTLPPEQLFKVMPTDSFLLVGMNEKYLAFPGARERRTEHILLSLVDELAAYEAHQESESPDRTEVLKRRTELWCLLLGRNKTV